MTKKAAIKVQQAAQAANVPIKVKRTAKGRATVYIGGRSYGGVVNAMDAITTAYIKAHR
jgi:hypothetical protein